MADTDIELSVDLDVTDAEKTAKQLQLEVQNIFDSRRGNQSAAMTNLELQMKKTYEQADELRRKMLELGKDVPTAEYSKVIQDIADAEHKFDELADKMYNIGDLKELAETYQAMGRAIQFASEQGVDKIIDERGLFGREGAEWSVDSLTARRAELKADMDELMKLDNEQKAVGESLDALLEKRRELEMSRQDIIIGKETAEYQKAQQELDLLNDKVKQQIIHYREMIQLEEQRAQKEEQKAQQESLRRQEAIQAHQKEQEIAQKQWEMAVQQEEIQAHIHQQHLEAEAEAQRIKQEAEDAKQAQQEARMEMIAANSSLMAMNMAIRSIGRIIPGVSTTAISGVVMLTRSVLRLTKLTKADLVMAIGKVKDAFAKLFSFIMAHPIVLVIAALIAAIVLLIKKLKELWDSSEEAAEELIDALKKGFEKLKEISLDFVSILVKGFIKLGNLLPSTLLKAIQTIIDKLKSLKSIIKENLDLMAKWNDGNNEVNTALSNITSSLNYLKATIATAVAPLLVQIEPIITHIVDVIADAITLIGMLIAKITGATTFTRAERVQTDYAKSLDKTANSAKNANKQLASFDKLNVLNTDKSSGSTAVSGVDFKAIKLIDEELPDWITNLGLLGKKVSNLINTFLGGIPWNDIKEKVSGLSSDFADFFNNLNIGASLGTTIGEGLNTIILAINTFLNELDAVHLGEELGDIIENAIITINWNDVGEMFAGGLNKLGEFIIGLSNRVEGKEIGKAFSEFLSGSLGNIDWKIMTEAISGVVSDLVDALNAMLTPENMELVGSTLSKVFNTLICGIQLFTNSAEWTEWGTSIGAGIAEFFRDIDWKSTAIVLGNFAKGLLNLIGSAIGELLKPDNLNTIINDLIDFFSNIPWDEIRQAAKEISTKLREGLSKIWEALRSSGAYDDIIKFVVEFLEEKENWDKLFAGFKSDVVADIFWGKIKGVLTAVGEAIAGAFRKLFNFLSDGISNIASFFGDFVFGDSSFSDWLNGKTPTQLNAPHMNAPQLAQGAVLPPNKPFLAMVGDQKNGTNIEAPLDTIKQAVAEVLANMQIKNVFDVQGDSNRLFKVVQKESNIYYDQHGYSAFKG